jgi:hypothetical protein
MYNFDELKILVFEPNEFNFLNTETFIQCSKLMVSITQTNII